MKPIIAIVGRPNVGKSTLFNKLIGKRLAIVENIPGVTRDRLYRDCEWDNKEFLLVDTGGLEPNSKDDIMQKVKKQVKIAISEADAIIFLVDGMTGLTALDEEIGQLLKKSNKQIIVAVNKIDDYKKKEDHIYEFYGLGFKSVVGISAEHKANFSELLDETLVNIQKANFENDERIKIAVVGRPNVGKSSLTNKILNDERNIVSDIAGTTRDSIDENFEFQNNKFTIIDTAGIRRKAKVDEDIEYYSVLRAIKAIKRADVVLVLIDSLEQVTEQDKKIAGIVEESNKPVIIAINKWDKVLKDTHTMSKVKKEIRVKLMFIQYAPILFISALTGQRIVQTLEKVLKLVEENNKKISTGILNEVLQELINLNPPSTHKGQTVKINYVTQISSRPPYFNIFSNRPELIHFSYERYIENKFREYFGFEGVPIRFKLSQKNN